MSKTTSETRPAAVAADSATTGTTAAITVPVYAAGAGLPEAAFAAARAAGLVKNTDAQGNVTFTGFEGRLAFEWAPDSYRYRTNPTGGLWQVRYLDSATPQDVWSAQFGDNVPAEAIGAFINALTSPDGLDPDRG